MKKLIFVFLSLVSLTSFAQIEWVFQDLASTVLTDPRRKLNGYEKVQVKVLKCAKYVLENNIGGYEAPLLIHNILKTITIDNQLSKDIPILEVAIEECQNLKQSFAAVRKLNSKILTEKITQLETSNKFKALILGLALPREKCVAYNLTARAAMIIGVGVGAGIVKCISSNGNLRNFIGPAFNLDLGIGAMVTVAANDTDSTKPGKGKFFRITTMGGEDYSDSEFYDADPSLDWALILGTLEDNDDATHLNLGLGAMTGKGAHMGFRVFNGQPRWDIILNRLK